MIILPDLPPQIYTSRNGRKRTTMGTGLALTKLMMCGIIPYSLKFSAFLAV
jgi:hypothetical protein